MPIERGGARARLQADRALDAQQRAGERHDDVRRRLRARLRVLGGGDAGHVARPLQQRVLEAAAGAEEGALALAGDPDRAQGAVHVAVRARRDAPEGVEGGQRVVVRQLVGRQPDRLDRDAEAAARAAQGGRDGYVGGDLVRAVADEADAQGLHAREGTGQCPRGRRPPPLRPRPVLRTPLRLLRLRHRHGPRAAARAVRRRPAGRAGAARRRARGRASRPSTWVAAHRRCSAPRCSAACSTPCRRRPSSARWRSTPRPSTPRLPGCWRRAAAASRWARRAFDAGLLAVLERRTVPEGVRAAVATLRAAGVDDLSLDLIYGVPGEAARSSTPTSTACWRWSPTTSPATSSRPSPARASRTATGARWRRRPSSWRTTWSASWTGSRRPATRGTRRPASRAPGHEGRHNSAYWRARDYLGLGVGAVGTVDAVRRRNAPAARAVPGGGAGGSRPAARRRSRSTPAPAAWSGSCSACAWPRASSVPRWRPSWTRRRCASWSRRARGGG